MEKPRRKVSEFIRDKMVALKSTLRDKTTKDPVKFGESLRKDAKALERRAEGKRSFRAAFYKLVVAQHTPILEAAKVYDRAATEFLRGSNRLKAAQCFEEAANIRAKIADSLKYRPKLEVTECLFAERDFLRASYFYSSIDAAGSQRAEQRAREQMHKLGISPKHYKNEMEKALKYFVQHPEGNNQI